MGQSEVRKDTARLSQKLLCSSVEIGVGNCLQQNRLHLLPDPIMYTSTKSVEGRRRTTRIGPYDDDLSLGIHIRDSPAATGKDDSLIDG
ncbi:hypothetical protein D9M71_629900 [compost metagenome]